MPTTFVGPEREQMFLLPPDITEWLPEDDLVWTVIDAVSQMDLSSFRQKHQESAFGRPAYDPSIMVSLLLYAYSLGIRSSRKIENLCMRDAGFRIITGNRVPDHSTIARFRKENQGSIKSLFTGTLHLCRKAGMGKLGVVALDGTKMRANASMSQNRTHDSIEKEVERILAEADGIDAQEDRIYGKDNSGDGIPEDMRKKSDRLAKLKKCKELLEREAEQAAGDQEEKINKRSREEKKTGKKKRGRKPKSASDARAEKEKKAKVNLTDPESRIMKNQKGFMQGFNAQAVVTEDQVIIACEVVSDENDVNRLHPMIEQAKENLEEAGIDKKISAVVADAGYLSEDNLEKKSEEPGTEEDVPELFIATKKDREQRSEPRDPSREEDALPENPTERQKMEQKLSTEEGRAIYKKRGQTVEPVFGQIKNARGIEEFVQRGIVCCSAEWSLICATHNLLKLWRQKLKTRETSGESDVGDYQMNPSLAVA